MASELLPAVTPAPELAKPSIPAGAMDGVGGCERASRKLLTAREIRW
jgi:hypothetical protein